MEEGESDLARTLKKQNKITLKTIKTYWRQMLQAVKIVHDQGIVHADLKPANFLFVGNQLKLIDFGISNKIQVINRIYEFPFQFWNSTFP